MIELFRFFILRDWQALGDLYVDLPHHYGMALDCLWEALGGDTMVCEMWLGLIGGAP